MSNKSIFLIGCVSIVITMFFSCNNKFTNTLFKGKTPHQQYEQQLMDAGLNGTALFKQWVNASKQSILQPISIDVPYLEEAYFAADKPDAVAFIFDARKGEQLQIELELQTLDSTRLFIDLFETIVDTIEQQSAIYSADTRDSLITYNIQDDGRYLLRIQPELLSDISYKLQITAEPSLANPVESRAKQNIGSFFGDGRDANSRRHEGIDIFAEKLTRVVAAANGIVSRVGTNNLGGKIIFLRPEGQSINLYYAHLDSQLVTTGQIVTLGDTLGLIGNTGNARTTPPHLHFGIYTRQGAVDPLPFIRPGKSNPSKITADTKRIGDTVRSINSSMMANIPLVINGVVQNSYRVVFPDKSKTFILQNQITDISKPLRTITLKQSKILYAEPDSSSAHKQKYQSGIQLTVAGEYNDFYFIENKSIKGWIKQ
ncbi:M23 family metallopeptidase [Albibacterium bauzanense]|uniref:Murein DD-endopeptidase MepM/ murein hydrolase activator NlpD n=1 Tax=Albibacterium bauzanense TaxID=653929 RepID=A0A4R1LQV0_9SPHI|nr:M23 family metallopeptidase [Albibacterium bauzanense]TCK80580.1 murein DD-endopeptidase MepM/ murein hydrolase activator NlpD [Albibacterium bauzanense]